MPGGAASVEREWIQHSADIVRVSLLENTLRTANSLRILCVDGNKDFPGLDSAFEPFGLHFWNAEIDQATRNPTKGSAHGGPAQGPDHRPGGNERPDPGNGQRCNTGDPSQRSAQKAAGRCAARSIPVLFMREIAHPSILHKQGGDVVVGKVRPFELIDNSISQFAGRGDAEHGFLGHEFGFLGLDYCW